jgi:hypothetical protein
MGDIFFLESFVPAPYMKKDSHTPPPPRFYPLKKVEVKFALEQAIKAQRGSRGIALLFLSPRR